jgi:phospholipase C
MITPRLRLPALVAITLLCFAALLAAFALPARCAPISPDPDVAKYAVPANAEPKLTHSRIAALLKGRIKYVFVIYQENRSFDSYFGTFPGADGLYSQPAAQTPGFTQPLENTDGTMTTIQPFRIGPDQFAADLDDVSHSHTSILDKMDIVDGAAKMDKFAAIEEERFAKGDTPSLKAKQYGELEMAYEDGDTIPFLWRYANRFVLCDHIFQLMTAGSSPGNLAIIGAQSGATQWMLHPDEAYTGDGASGRGLPDMNDANPYWGSFLDTTTDGRMPYGAKDLKKKPKPDSIQYNLTFATVPLTLTGQSMADVAKSDRDPVGDLADVKDDIATISSKEKQTLGWGWYQEGYGNTEPVSGADPVDAYGLHASYVTHHNGPQYFGYIANNPKMASSMRDINDFISDVKSNSLPGNGGLFFIKGGYRNFLGLKPVDPDPKVQADFLGDDEHPGDSDSQVSDAMIATMINTIARSSYWSHCAIIITYDDSEGDYDHVPPPIRATGPDGSTISDGPRVPFLVISPYCRTHAVDHDMGDHASVVKFADTAFGLIPLADLPDEEKGRAIGESKGLKNEGPFDDHVADVTDLTGAFDPARLAGRAAPLPAEYAIIPDDLVKTLPQANHIGLAWTGVTPTDYALGINNVIPADFNPRPTTDPSPDPNAGN